MTPVRIEITQVRSAWFKATAAGESRFLMLDCNVRSLRSRARAHFKNQGRAVSVSEVKNKEVA